MSFLIDARDKGAKALREYELKRDSRPFGMPYDKLSGDAKEVARKAFDRLVACFAVAGLKVIDVDAAPDDHPDA